MFDAVKQPVGCAADEFEWEGCVPDLQVVPFPETTMSPDYQEISCNVRCSNGSDFPSGIM